MAFTTSGQETEWTLFLQPRSPHGAAKCKAFTGLAVKELKDELRTTSRQEATGKLTTSRRESYTYVSRQTS